MNAAEHEYGQRSIALLIAAFRGDEEGQVVLLDEIGPDRRDAMRHLVTTLDHITAIFGDKGPELADRCTEYAIRFAREGAPE